MIDLAAEKIKSRKFENIKNLAIARQVRLSNLQLKNKSKLIKKRGRIPKIKLNDKSVKQIPEPSQHSEGSNYSIMANFGIKKEFADLLPQHPPYSSRNSKFKTC